MMKETFEIKYALLEIRSKCSAKYRTNLKYSLCFLHNPLELSTKKPAAALPAGTFSPRNTALFLVVLAIFFFLII